MASVLELSKKINKAWKQDVLTDGTVLPETKRVSLGSLGADYPLFGGLPRGAVTVFAGLEHSGKTLAAVQAMANYQKEEPNSTCIYVDGEQALVSQIGFLSKMTGLIVDDPNRFLRYDTSGKSAEEIFQDLIELQQADNIGLIVIDSAPVLVSQSDIDSDFTKDNGQRASIAKSLGKFLKQMIMYLPKRNNALLIINQVRESVKTFTGATIYTEPCGYALRYYPSMKVRFGTRCFTLGDKTDIPSSKGDDADGFRLKFSITKNRLGPVNRGGGFLTYRYATGLDNVNDMLEIALKYGYIQRPTTQSYLLVNLDTGEVYTDAEGNDLKFVGKQKLIDFLNANIEFRNQYVDMLARNISSSGTKSLLDEETMKEIFDQEASVEGNLSAEEQIEKATLENE